MSNSASLLAYPDVKSALDSALNSERGVRVAFKNAKEAQKFVWRCNHFRHLDRKENLKIYPEPAHTMHGRSPYDVLVVKHSETVVTIVPIKPDDVTVELL